MQRSSNSELIRSCQETSLFLFIDYLWAFEAFEAFLGLDGKVLKGASKVQYALHASLDNYSHMLHSKVSIVHCPLSIHSDKSLDHSHTASHIPSAVPGSVPSLGRLCTHSTENEARIRSDSTHSLRNRESKRRVCPLGSIP